MCICIKGNAIVGGMSWWRENGKVVITSNVNVSVQANRRTGKTGNVKMIFNNGRFIEEEWKNEEKDEDYGDFKWKI